MRVLVCGGRGFSDWPLLGKTLDDLHAECGISSVIHGCALGADALALQWAVTRDIHNELFRADWNNYGRKAGPARNQRMIDDGKPDLVVAFPGGAGTADMVRRSRTAGITVIEVAAAS